MKKKQATKTPSSPLEDQLLAARKTAEHWENEAQKSRAELTSLEMSVRRTMNQLSALLLSIHDNLLGTLKK